MDKSLLISIAVGLVLGIAAAIFGDLKCKYNEAKRTIKFLRSWEVCSLQKVCGKYSPYKADNNGDEN